MLYDSQNGRICLCDFGLARFLPKSLPEAKEALTELVVTLYYRPPELLLGSHEYTTSVDMWSAGCVVAEMMLNKVFIPGEGEIDQLSRMFDTLGSPQEDTWPEITQLPLAQSIRWRSNPPLPSKLRDIFPIVSYSGKTCLTDDGIRFLEALLTYNPKTRYSAARALRHSWFSSDPLPQPTHLLPKIM